MKSNKKERNEEIKHLCKEGKYTQKEIAKKYGISQSRINAIIFDRLPIYRYCRWCGVNAKGKTVCDSCRKKVLIHQKKERTRRFKEKTKLRLLKESARLAEAKMRYENKEKEILLRLQRAKVRIEKFKLNKEIYPKEWMGEGRERTRRLVRLRDNHTCQDCGYIRTPNEVEKSNRIKKFSKKNLDVHHLEGMCGKKSKGYDTIEDIGKLITLCHKCHFNRPEHRIKSKEYSINMSKSLRKKSKK